MAVRLNDVAKRAGVALDTARRALDGAPSVRPYLRERVEAAARDLGYQPNLVARALKEKKLWIVPVSVIELGNPFFGSLALNIGNELVAQGLEPILCVSPEHLHNLRRAVTTKAAILAIGLQEERVRALSREMKLVTINSSLPAIDNVCDIEFDFVAAYREICARLLKQGRRQGAIYSPSYAQLFRNKWRDSKVEMIQSVCREAGLGLTAEPERVVFCDEASILQALRQGQIDTVFCENDMIAAKLSLAMQADGMRQDLQLIGCDGNYPFAGLWSIQLDTAQIAAQAVKMLLRLYEFDDAPERIMLPLRVVGCDGAGADVR